MPPRFRILIQRLYILLIGGLISYIYKNPAYLVVYEYANQLQTMPVQAFLKFSFSGAVTYLSELAEFSKRTNCKTLNKVFIKINFFYYACNLCILVLKIPLVRILYGGDKFSWLGTNLTSYTLSFFSVSIWFQSINAVFFRVFSFKIQLSYYFFYYCF